MATDSIIAIIGAVGGTTAIVELAKFILTRRSNKRKAEAEADDKWFAKYEHQLDRMNTQIEFKDKRIEDLNNEIADKEKSYIEQTKRLRESQDNEHCSQLEINHLNGVIIGYEQKICQLELQLKDVRCHRLTCLDRQPKNDHTRHAEAEVEAGAPIEELKQTIHRKTNTTNENSDRQN